MWDWSIVSKIWLCLLIAAILGAIIGWLLKTLFGSDKNSTEHEAKLRDKDNEISKLKASLSNVAAAAKTENTKDEAEIAGWKKQLSTLEKELEVCHERQYTIEGELKDWNAKAATLSSAGAIVLDNKDEAEVDFLRIKLQEAESEKLYLLGKIKRIEAGETLKVVPMEQRDDLELINGVGPVLERMLYDMGVYFFKDIAAWDTAKIEEMNEKLPNFRGRIEREGWVDSAKDEHFKKYGEKL